MIVVFCLTPKKSFTGVMNKSAGLLISGDATMAKIIDNAVNAVRTKYNMQFLSGIQ
jgi:hypothetical protein